MSYAVQAHPVAVGDRFSESCQTLLRRADGADLAAVEAAEIEQVKKILFTRQAVSGTLPPNLLSLAVEHESSARKAAVAFETAQRVAQKARAWAVETDKEAAHSAAARLEAASEALLPPALAAQELALRSRAECLAAVPAEITAHVAPQFRAQISAGIAAAYAIIVNRGVGAATHVLVEIGGHIESEPTAFPHINIGVWPVTPTK